MKRRWLTFCILLGLFSPALAEKPYWSWGPDQAKEYQAEARETLKRHPESLKALNKLAKALIISDYGRPQGDQQVELLKVLEHSFRIEPAQTTATLLAQYGNNSEQIAGWAAKALAFPNPSRHALEVYERQVQNEPSLNKFEDEHVRRARRRLERWRKIVSSYGTIKNDMFKAYSQEPQDRRFPSSKSIFEMKGKKLIASSQEGQTLWTKDLGQDNLKLVSFEARLFVFTPTKILIIDPSNGQILQTWPSLVSTKLVDAFPIAWTAWEHPQLLLGADEERAYVAVSNWFCVLRQKDAQGWARYFGYTVRAVPCSDQKVLIIETHGNSVVAHRLSDGEELWSYWPGNLELDLRRVTNEKVVAYIPGLERILIFDRDTGKVLEKLSYQTMKD